MDQHNLEALPPPLRSLKFTVQPCLRSKTFYALTPFSRFPSQTMPSLSGDTRLLEGVTALPSHTIVPSSWQYLRADQFPSYSDAVRNPSSIGLCGNQKSSESDLSLYHEALSQSQWLTTLEIAAETPASLIPTFCSAVASRQYSLLIRIKVSGVSVEKYILEVPLQLVYSPKDSGELGSSMETPEQTAMLSGEERNNAMVSSPRTQDLSVPMYANWYSTSVWRSFRLIRDERVASRYAPTTQYCTQIQPLFKSSDTSPLRNCTLCPS